MKYHAGILCVVALLCPVLCHGQRFFAPGGTAGDEVSVIVTTLEQSSACQDAAGFDKVYTQKAKDLAGRDPFAYARLTHVACEMARMRFGKGTGGDLAEKYALSALAKPEKLRPDYAALLLNSLRPSDDRNSNVAKMKLWFDTWRRLEQDADPAFDPDRGPVYPYPGPDVVPPRNAEERDVLARDMAYATYYAYQTNIQMLLRSYCVLAGSFCAMCHMKTTDGLRDTEALARNSHLPDADVRQLMARLRR